VLTETREHIFVTQRNFEFIQTPALSAAMNTMEATDGGYKGTEGVSWGKLLSWGEDCHE